MIQIKDDEVKGPHDISSCLLLHKYVLGSAAAGLPPRANASPVEVAQAQTKKKDISFTYQTRARLL